MIYNKFFSKKSTFFTWPQKRILRKIFLFLLILLWFFSGFPQIWQNPSVPPQIQEAQAQEWLDNWFYRKEITIDSSKIDDDLIDIPVLVSLSTSTFDFSKARSDGYDIRFTSDDGETLLDYERERHDDANESAEYWVKTNASSTASTTFYMYYGNPTASDGESATSTWNNDYAGVWHKNDGPSQAILDSTANENHGTKKGSGEPAEADGKIGKAQSYDGSDDYVNLSDSSFLPFGTGAFSIAFWFKPIALTTSWNTLFETRPSNSLTGIWFGVRAGIFEIYQDTAKWNGTTTISNNNWYHVVIIGNGGAAGSRNIKVYLNGTQEGSTWTTDYNLTNIRLWFGRYHGSGLCWPGLIDEISVSDIARSEAWIKANYYAENDDLITFGEEHIPDVDVTTEPASNKSFTSARLNGELLDMQEEGSVYVWFKWREIGVGTWNETSKQEKTATGTFFADLSSLDSGTNYEFQAFTSALGGDKEERGIIRTFTTLELSVKTNPATGKTSSSARLNGEIIDAAGESSVYVWFEWREKDIGSWATTTKQTKSSGTFYHDLSSLDDSKTYQFRAHIATTENEYENNGDILEFILPVWWNSDWQYRKLITIDHTKIDQDLTDFPVLVKLASSTFDFSKATSTGHDIRFTDSLGTTTLKHERERHDSINEIAEYWVKIPSVASSTYTEFYMYYGNPEAGDGADPTNVWDSNHVMVQHLQETSGTHYDSTSNGKNGTVFGDTNQNIEGKIDGADSFDGTGDYIDCGNNTITGNNSFTLEAWINTNTVSKYSGALSIGASGSNQSAYIGTVSSVQVGTSSSIGGGFFGRNYGSGVNTTGQWFYLVMTFSGGSNGTAIIYVNGEEKLTDTRTPNLQDTYTRIGRIGSDTAYDFNGIADEVIVSNTARSAAWIKAKYYSGDNALLTYGDEEIKEIVLLTAIKIRAQNYIDSVSSIIFPEGASGSTVSQPYNNTDGSSNPQTFGEAGTAKPVVTLYNSNVSGLKIWYNITTFTNNIVSEQYYLINDKGAACSDAACITQSVVFDIDTDTGITITSGPGNEKDLYLKINLSQLAGKSGTSTLTILGESL